MSSTVNFPATSTAGAAMSDSAAAVQYMNFIFLRLDVVFHQLMTNEKVVARQEFMASFDSFQSRLPVATYALTGLRSDCDVLFWRLSPSLDELSRMSVRLQESGLGKYLFSTHSFMGCVPATRYPWTPGAIKEPKGVLGTAPYLFVRPVWGRSPDSLPDPSKFPSAQIHVTESLDLPQQGFILAFETSEPADWRGYLAAWSAMGSAPSQTQQEPTFVCLLREMRDIVDSFG